jgi:hypothetical protein
LRGKSVVGLDVGPTAAVDAAHTTVALGPTTGVVWKKVALKKVVLVAGSVVQKKTTITMITIIVLGVGTPVTKITIAMFGDTAVGITITAVAPSTAIVTGTEGQQVLS